MDTMLQKKGLCTSGIYEKRIENEKFGFGEFMHLRLYISSSRLRGLSVLSLRLSVLILNIQITCKIFKCFTVIAFCIQCD